MAGACPDVLYIRLAARHREIKYVWVNTRSVCHEVFRRIGDGGWRVDGWCFLPTIKNSSPFCPSLTASALAAKTSFVILLFKFVDVSARWFGLVASLLIGTWGAPGSYWGGTCCADILYQLQNWNKFRITDHHGVSLETTLRRRLYRKPGKISVCEREIRRHQRFEHEINVAGIESQIENGGRLGCTFCRNRIPRIMVGGYYGSVRWYLNKRKRSPADSLSSDCISGEKFLASKVFGHSIFNASASSELWAAQQRKQRPFHWW